MSHNFEPEEFSATTYPLHPNDPYSRLATDSDLSDEVSDAETKGRGTSISVLTFALACVTIGVWAILGAIINVATIVVGSLILLAVIITSAVGMIRWGRRRDRVTPAAPSSADSNSTTPGGTAVAQSES